jgi:hypothetical protein
MVGSLASISYAVLAVLSIVKSVWAWVQAEVDKTGWETFDKFVEVVKDAISDVPKDMI